MLLHALEALDFIRDCRRKRGGKLTQTALSGGERAHPLLAVEERAAKRFDCLWSALNFTSGFSDNPYRQCDNSPARV